MRRAKGGKQVVLSDIAAMFDVAPITVSRALRRTGQVAPKLEAALIKAAGQLGYSIETQFHARALRQRRTGTQMMTDVFCAIVRDAATIGSSPFHLRIMSGLERGARESKSELLVVPYTVAAPRGTESLLPRVVMRRQVDGVVWLLSELDLKHMDTPCPVPVVTLLMALPGMDAILVDDCGSMREVGEYLAQCGHRRVAYIGPDSELAGMRLAGLRAGLAVAGGTVNDSDVRMGQMAMLPETVVPLVREVMGRFKAAPEAERFSAIAVYNDYMAVTVIRCLQEEYGLSVPGDLSVTGFDGLDIVAAGLPKLATAAIPLEELGVEAVRMIGWRVQNIGQSERRVTLRAPLVEGASVRSLPAG